MTGSNAGKVWLVGAGPGDPGLLTLKGKEALEQATVVVYDRLVSEAILCTISPEVRLINAGKLPGNHPLPQEEINRILVEEARRGERVVRLKGGDPYLFGRGGEEARSIAAAGISFEMISGVSSAFAVPADAGIPLTHRDLSSSVHIITWHKKQGIPAEEALAGLARTEGTLVILMGTAALKDIRSHLVKAGFDPELPAAVISRGTTPERRTWITTLNKLGDDTDFEGLLSPALVILGRVCSLGKPSSAAGPIPDKKRPLTGLRIVVTRPEPGNAELCRQIRELGGTALPLPCIKTVALDNSDDAVYQNIGQYNWIAFTSVTGVDIFFDTYLQAGGDFRELAHCRFAAVGPVTAEALLRHGFIADHIPANCRGRSRGEGLAENIRPGEKLLLIRPVQGEPGLIEILRDSGVSFRELAVYNTVPVEIGGYVRKIIEEGRFDYVFFTSPSAVSAFGNTFTAAAFSAIRAVCIGKSTADKAWEYGMETWVSAEASTDAMVQFLTEKHKPGD
jgi:uroporphyrinogen III methyltransferase/synthase